MPCVIDIDGKNFTQTDAVAAMAEELAKRRHGVSWRKLPGDAQEDLTSDAEHCLAALIGASIVAKQRAERRQQKAKVA